MRKIPPAKYALQALQWTLHSADLSAEEREAIAMLVKHLEAASPTSALVVMSRPEIEAALNAMGQMTDGNARDFVEWRKCTSGSRAEWLALLRAEDKLQEAIAHRAVEQKAAARF